MCWNGLWNNRTHFTTWHVGFERCNCCFSLKSPLMDARYHHRGKKKKAGPRGTHSEGIRNGEDPPQTKSWVTVKAKSRGLVVIKLNPTLYDNHMFNCTNGVVEIETSRPFKVLESNNSKCPETGCAQPENRNGITASYILSYQTTSAPMKCSG